MIDFKPILTSRLIIRKLEINDSPRFFKYRSLPEVYEFQSFQPTKLKEAEEFIKQLANTPNIPNTWFQLAICLREDETLIGDIGIHFLNDTEQTEIGYTIAPEFWHLGYGIEAVNGVMKYIFEELGKHRIIASVDPSNEKSLNLLSMIGMRREAHFKKSVKRDGIWIDNCIYAILEEEWKKRFKN